MRAAQESRRHTGGDSWGGPRDKIVKPTSTITRIADNSFDHTMENEYV